MVSIITWEFLKVEADYEVNNFTTLKRRISNK